MNRALVNELPEQVEAIFRRAEQDIDTVRTTPTQIAEVAFAFARNERVAGVKPAVDAREAVRTLLAGPVDTPRLGRDVFLRLGPLFDVYSMHDAILVAAHKSQQTDGILTNDEEIRTYDGDAVVWD